MDDTYVLCGILYITISWQIWTVREQSLLFCHLPLEIMDLALRMAVRLRAVFLSFFDGWEKRFS